MSSSSRGKRLRLKKIDMCVCRNMGMTRDRPRRACDEIRLRHTYEGRHSGKKSLGKTENPFKLPSVH
jgi:hypothetical protein